MANERELAALKAQIAAIEQAHGHAGSGRASQHYIVHAQVFSDCHAPIEEPPTEPVDARSVHARLDRIEAQLQRVLTALEQRGS